MRWFKTLSLLVGGVACGLALSLIRPVREQPSAPAPAVSGAGIAPLRRTGELEQTRRPVRPPPSPQGEDGEAVDRMVSAADAEEEDGLEQHRSMLARHDAEEPDPAWSARTTTALAADLFVLAQQLQLRLSDVDCRRTLCTAKFESKTYGRALSSYSKVLEHPNTIGCGTMVALPAPADSAAPYIMDFVYLCRGAQSAGQQQ